MAYTLGNKCTENNVVSGLF